MKTPERILIPLLMLSTITGIRAEEDDPIERYMMDHMFDFPEEHQGANVGQAIGELKGSIMSLGSAIAQARQEFWSAYARGGPAFHDASKRLSKLLFEKDLWYLLKSLSEEPSSNHKYGGGRL